MTLMEYVFQNVMRLQLRKILKEKLAFSVYLVLIIALLA